MNKILIAGSGGQIGTELVKKLRATYGNSNVVASDLRQLSGEIVEQGPFERIDSTQITQIIEVVKKYEIDTIYNFHSCHFWLPVSVSIGMSLRNSGRFGPSQSLKMASTGRGIGILKGISRSGYLMAYKPRTRYFGSPFLTRSISKGSAITSFAYGS